MDPVTDLRITGMDELLASLGALDEKGMRKLATQSIKRSLKGTVEALKREAPRGPAPHRSSAKGRRGRKGPLSRNVTVRSLRRRTGELVALQAGPRAWYKHFVIRGTKAHVIEARAADGSRATSSEVRRINRFESGYYRTRKGHLGALLISSRFVFRVRHPGASGNDFVSRAASGQGERVRDALAKDMAIRVEAARRAA